MCRIVQVVLTLVAGIWIVFFALIFLPAVRERAPVERSSSRYLPRSVAVAVFAMILVILVSIFAPVALASRIVPDTLLFGMAGLFLIVSGLGFSAWARHHLGRYWSSMVQIKVGHRLITTGPYRIVRNPMYTGILIAFCGTAIAIGEMFAFVALLIGLVSIWVKIQSEEEILTEKFGEEYLQYKREVKALIPFLL